MTVWFTADTHFNHKGVIRMCNRPFTSVEAMNETLVENWNDVVHKDDTVYFLGDFAFGTKKHTQPILGRLQGRKHLIMGNHDRQNKVQNLAGWESCLYMDEVVVQDPDAYQGRQRITLCHYPMVTWRERHQGGWQMHGHSHGHYGWPPESRRIDVGVDCWSQAPVSYEQVKETIEDLGI